MTITNYGLFTPYTPTHLPADDPRIIAGAAFVRCEAADTDFYDLRNSFGDDHRTFLVVNQDGLIRQSEHDASRIVTPANAWFVSIPRVEGPATDLRRKLCDLSTGVVSDPPAPEPVPPTVVTKAQGKLALLAAGLLDDAEAAISAAGPAAQIWYADATEWRRSHPVIAQMATALGLSAAQVDALFVAAAAIQ